MSDLNDMIDSALDAARPDRYHPGDADWFAAIIDIVAAEIPDDDARRKVARDIVVRREAEATKRTNKVLREIVATSQLPLDWMDLQRWPLGVGEERVALGACMADDFREFANIERRRAANEFATRNESCEGAVFMADLIEDKGVTFAADLPTPAVES